MPIDREIVIRLAREAHLGCGYFDGLWSACTADLECFAAIVLEHGRKPLTDEQIEMATGAKRGQPLFLVAKWFTTAIEAAHDITNKESSDAE